MIKNHNLEYDQTILISNMIKLIRIIISIFPGPPDQESVGRQQVTFFSPKIDQQFYQNFSTFAAKIDQQFYQNFSTFSAKIYQQFYLNFSTCSKN